MIEKLSIKDFISKSKDHPLIDVRSPAEYKHAHIPGAHSIPLFTDEERKLVGIAYKQESREKAIKLGLDFFGPKMKPIIEQIEQLSKLQTLNPQPSTLNSQPPTLNPQPSTIFLYCWRGGMRSAAIAWLLDLYGYKVYTLAGGYKSYRRLVLESFKQSYSFRILGGYTGSAKTELLKELRKKNETIIDLEDLAKHKGSAFGNIGMPAQPGQEMFENLLSDELRENENTDPIWLEDESQRIGHVNIPNDLWTTMRESPVYFLDIPFEERLKHIVQEYGQLDRQKLVDAIERIREKLGGLNAKTAISLLDSGDTIGSFRILLEYYDKFYTKALHNRKNLNSLLISIPCKSISPENANQLINLHPAHKLQKV